MLRTQSPQETADPNQRRGNRHKASECRVVKSAVKVAERRSNTSVCPEIPLSSSRDHQRTRAGSRQPNRCRPSCLIHMTEKHVFRQRAISLPLCLCAILCVLLARYREAQSMQELC